jgi:hypothetical protein
VDLAKTKPSVLVSEVIFKSLEFFTKLIEISKEMKKMEENNQIRHQDMINNKKILQEQQKLCGLLIVSICLKLNERQLV